ncbi:acetate--CoA ligase family protein [Actinomadura viridis]|uniref:acetate--CoA ligase family protein n=1 Tax=Actinomadura viridis TaxID=58110 RepID=UPI0036A15927
MKPSLTAMFAPRSIALVGASTKPQSLSQRMLRMMHAQLEGIELTAVHPKASEIAGVPAVPRLAQVAVPPDLVVVATPASGVVGAIDDAISVGARAAIVCSSGFDETGQEPGRRLRDELASRSDRIRILGPNCQGLYHRPTGLVATFTPSIRDVELPLPAPIGYVGQSGAVGGALGDMLRERGVALRTWASTGNQIDVDVVDLADHLVETGELALLMLYLEGLPDGGRWQALSARAAEAGVRLAVLRGGRSGTGALAVASHTGSLVRDAAGFELVCGQYGVLMADDIDDLCDLAVVEAAARPTGDGGRQARAGGVAVLSSSGGAGALAADLATSAGLPLATLSAATRARMAQHLPSFASTQNPVDVTAQLFTGDPAAFAEVCSAVSEDPDVSAIVVILSLILDPAAEQLASRFVAVAEKLDVPLAMVYLASRDRTAGARSVLRAGGLPVFDSVRRAVGALASAGFRGQAEPSPASGGGTLPQTSSELTVLDDIGVTRPAVEPVRTAEETRRAIERFGGRAVVKLGGAVSHKTELGAVRVGVPSDAAAEVFAEFDALSAGLEAVVEVHELAPAGVELLVSVLGARDGYPPLVTVGWGGTLVELHRDTVTFPATLTPSQVAERCRELRCWRLIEGWRGAPAHDGAAALEAVARLTAWAVEQGTALRELEINPLIVHESGVTAVDVVLGREDRHADRR